MAGYRYWSAADWEQPAVSGSGLGANLSALSAYVASWGASEASPVFNLLNEGGGSVQGDAAWVSKSVNNAVAGGAAAPQESSSRLATMMGGDGSASSENVFATIVGAGPSSPPPEEQPTTCEEYRDLLQTHYDEMTEEWKDFFKTHCVRPASPVKND